MTAAFSKHKLFNVLSKVSALDLGMKLPEILNANLLVTEVGGIHLFRKIVPKKAEIYSFFRTFTKTNFSHVISRLARECESLRHPNSEALEACQK